MGSDEDDLLIEQAAYYRARAAEYDRVYAERRDLQELLATVDELPIAGDVLELACGTGQWTALLAARARSVTAVDASPEMLEIARGRTSSSNVLRSVDDGRRYGIVKVFHDVAELSRDLAALGWSARIAPAGTFLVGVAEPAVRQ